MAVRLEAIATLLYLMCRISFLNAQPDGVFSSSYNSGLQNTDHFSAQSDAFVTNPAILAFAQSTLISAQVQSKYTGFDIFSYGLHILLPVPGNLGAGISLLQFGKENYTYFRSIISVGKQLSPEIGLGFSQHLSRSRIAGNSRPWHGSSIISLTYKNETWGTALQINDFLPFGTTLTGQKSWSVTLASVFDLTTMTSLFLTANGVRNNFEASIGLRQKLISNVELFAGFQIYPSHYGIGIMIPLLDYLQGIVSTELHPILGWSPSIGIQWIGDKKDSDSASD